MDERPIASIIIPVYNSEKYLAQCLDSILSQTCKNFEVILVNDGSTDNSWKICEKYCKKDTRFKLINKQNSGVASARNEGLKKAIGNYIMFLDSDDKMFPRCIEESVKIALSNNVDIVKFSYIKKKGILRKMYRYDSLVNHVISKDDFNEKIFRNIFCNYDFTNVWTMLISADIAKKVRFEEYNVGEDFLYSVKCLCLCKSIYIINKALYVYRINSKSVTHVKNTKHTEDEIKVLNRISKIVNNNYGLENRINKCLALNDKKGQK